MSAYRLITVDYTDAQVDVSPYEHHRKKDSIKFEVDNDMIVLSPDVVIKAMLIVAKEGIPNGVLDNIKAEIIKKYLED